MITIKAKFDTNGTAYPITKCDLKYGSKFDGVNYYYFESELEYTDWINAQFKNIPIEEPKTDLSNIDIDSFTNEQLLILANKLKALM